MTLTKFTQGIQSKIESLINVSKSISIIEKVMKKMEASTTIK